MRSTADFPICSGCLLLCLCHPVLSPHHLPPSALLTDPHTLVQKFPHLTTAPLSYSSSGPFLFTPCSPIAAPSGRTAGILRGPFGSTCFHSLLSTYPTEGCSGWLAGNQGEWIVCICDCARGHSQAERRQAAGKSKGGERNEPERQKKYFWEMRQGKKIVCVCVCLWATNRRNSACWDLVKLGVPFLCKTDEALHTWEDDVWVDGILGNVLDE